MRGATIPPNECPNYRASDPGTAQSCFTCISADYVHIPRDWHCKKHHCVVRCTWICDDYSPRWVKRKI